MFNRIGIVYPYGLNKGFSLRFFVGFQVQHETPEKGRRIYRPKCCEYNNKDKANSPNILRNDHYQVSSQRFKQILLFLVEYYQIKTDIIWFSSNF